MCDFIKIEKTASEIQFEKLCKEIKPQDNDVLFIAGSLIEGQSGAYSKGMGNTKSDIDVFIITDNIEYYQTVDYNEKFCKTKFIEMEGMQFDVEIYQYEQVVSFFKTLDNIRFEDAKMDDVRIKNLFGIEKAATRKYMSLIHRLLNSICVYNCVRYDMLKEQICVQNYNIYNIKRQVNYIDLYYDDAIGYLKEKQGILALCMARNLLLHACGAYLFANNISFDREKWIPLLLENYATNGDTEKTVYTRFKKLLFEVKLEDNNDYLRNAKEILIWINELIENIQEKD